jgi:hypothetical protein
MYFTFTNKQPWQTSDDIDALKRLRKEILALDKIDRCACMRVGGNML